MTPRRPFLLMLALLPLGACDGDKSVAAPVPIDPVVQAALNDQLLVDPDLSRQNEANATFTGGIDHALPLPDDSDAARRAALEEAQDLLGGVDRIHALPVAEKAGPLPRAATISASAFARATLGEDACIASLSTGFAWAARMPEAFPVYPRAATQSAAGAAGTRCETRAIDFRTPVAPTDVLEFYHSTAVEHGYRTRLSTHGSDSVLKGRRSDAGFAVRVRALEGGMTEVDFVTRES